jgi:hypothetical protein
MAQTNRTYGKDNPERFISGALTGGSGASNGMHDRSIGRGQTLKTALPMDNVVLAMPIKSSIEDMDWAGGDNNLKHSLTGVSAVNEDVGAAGSVKHTIFKDH